MSNMIKIFHQTLIPILTGFALFVCLPANASNHQPTLSFSFGEQSVNDIKVSESAGFIKITATLSEPSTEEVSFSFIQTVGSAEIFKDFSFPESITGDVAGNEKSATLVIEPGTQEIVFPLVLIRDDNLDELDETFFFLLRSNKGATLEQSSIKITILDNEETPVIVLSAPGLNRN
ncbi:MAG TPA: hypothetical protein ENK06_08240, partial [Gammaproteobacteria bacterium]|nr:hypothetical protein [Gammaproteobacteria bacterium]